MLEFFGAIYLGLAGWFVFGSLFFWIALIALSGLIFWFDDKEAPVLGTLTVLATLFLFNVSGLLPISGPTTFLIGVVAYLGIGVGWSFVKWFSFLRNKKEKFLEIKAAFIKNNNEDYKEGGEGFSKAILTENGSIPRGKLDTDITVAIPEHSRDNFMRTLRNHNYFGSHHESFRNSDDEVTIVPSAANNKARIMGWMTYWPWSALWTLIHDPIRKAVKALWRHLATSYQRLADKAFSGVTDDFK